MSSLRTFTTLAFVLIPMLLNPTKLTLLTSSARIQNSASIHNRNSLSQPHIHITKTGEPPTPSSLLPPLYSLLTLTVIHPNPQQPPHRPTMPRNPNWPPSPKRQHISPPPPPPHNSRLPIPPLKRLDIPPSHNMRMRIRRHTPKPKDMHLIDFPHHPARALPSPLLPIQQRE